MILVRLANVANAIKSILACENIAKPIYKIAIASMRITHLLLYLTKKKRTKGFSRILAPFSRLQTYRTNAL